MSTDIYWKTFPCFSLLYCIAERASILVLSEGYWGSLDNAPSVPSSFLPRSSHTPILHISDPQSTMVTLMVPPPLT